MLAENSCSVGFETVRSLLVTVDSEAASTEIRAFHGNRSRTERLSENSQCRAGCAEFIAEDRKPAICIVIALDRAIDVADAKNSNASGRLTVDSFCRAAAENSQRTRDVRRSIDVSGRVHVTAHVLGGCKRIRDG